MTDTGVPSLTQPLASQSTNQISPPWYRFLLSLWKRPFYLYTFDQYGAVGDGVTDDSAAINACTAAAVAAGATLVLGSPGKTYRIASPLLPRRNLIWDFQGAALSAGADIWMFESPTDTTKVAIGTVVGDVAGPVSALLLSSTAGLQVGDWIAVRLGDNAWDAAEPRYAFAAIVTAIAGPLVGFDHVVPYNITLSTAASNNKTVYKIQADNPINLVFRNVELRGDAVSPGIEGGFLLQWGVNIRFEGVNGNLSATGDMGAALFGLLQFVRDVYIGPSRLYSNRNTRGQASFGRMLSFSNALDVVVDQPACTNLQGTVGVFESYCERIVVRNASIEVVNGVARSGYNVFSVLQGSQVEIENPCVYAATSVSSLIDIGGTTADRRITGQLYWRGPMPLSFFDDARDFEARLDWANGTDYVVVDYRTGGWHSVELPIVASSVVEGAFPGPIIEAYAATSSGVVSGSITDFRVGFEGDNGNNYVSAVSPGNLVFATATGGGANYGGINRLAKYGKVLIAPDATVQPADAFAGAVVRCAAVIQSSVGHLGAGGASALSDKEMSQLLQGHA